MVRPGALQSEKMEMGAEEPLSPEAHASLDRVRRRVLAVGQSDGREGRPTTVGGWDPGVGQARRRADHRRSVRAVQLHGLTWRVAVDLDCLRARGVSGRQIGHLVEVRVRRGGRDLELRRVAREAHVHAGLADVAGRVARLRAELLRRARRERRGVGPDRAGGPERGRVDARADAHPEPRTVGPGGAVHPHLNAHGRGVDVVGRDEHLPVDRVVETDATLDGVDGPLGDARAGRVADRVRALRDDAVNPLRERDVAEHCGRAAEDSTHRARLVAVDDEAALRAGVGRDLEVGLEAVGRRGVVRGAEERAVGVGLGDRAARAFTLDVDLRRQVRAALEAGRVGHRHPERVRGRRAAVVERHALEARDAARDGRARARGRVHEELGRRAVRRPGGDHHGGLEGRPAWVAVGVVGRAEPDRVPHDRGLDEADREARVAHVHENGVGLDAPLARDRDECVSAASQGHRREGDRAGRVHGGGGTHDRVDSQVDLGPAIQVHRGGRDGDLKAIRRAVDVVRDGERRARGGVRDREAPTIGARATRDEKARQCEPERSSSAGHLEHDQSPSRVATDPSPSCRHLSGRPREFNLGRTSVWTPRSVDEAARAARAPAATRRSLGAPGRLG